MVQIDLNVPYAEKDEAKSLGAKWDWEKKVWYVPEGADPQPFARWLPTILDDEFSIRADRYYIGQTTKSCWKCQNQTNIFGFLLDGDHDLLMDYECPDSDELVLSWEHIDEPATIAYIGHLPDSIQKRISALTTHFYPDTSKMAGSQYWMNHCERCEAKLGDFYIHSDPGLGGFFPLDVKQAAMITLYRIDEPFKLGSCSHGGPVYFFNSMRVMPLNRRSGFWGRWVQRFFQKDET